ncbi:Proline porter II [Rickettsia tamurae subsp. buchneri]|uniref:Proline porter II n=1 Tax=Rickettsia tamurae subsp. buchneri TaxID=1462938 RepID=A0A8E0WMU9_9RICK|nr:Proline porter II [Rickettsia tamurae subsp. buchneri]
MPEYIRHDEGTFSSLTKQQKEAIGLLSIGTFLEYFDLMLYVHMAVVLNELFFPKFDPNVASFLSAAAFCSTYALRPFGALIFGYIGDNIGRKLTVIITTFMMAISCIIMANLPTYDQIGMKAVVIMTVCRMIQGISSIGERIGAGIYITEITKPPIQYAAVTLIGCLAALGGTVALAIASLVTSQGFNWRIAFWIGAIVAVIGFLARTSLRETPEFVNAKRRIQNILDAAKLDSQKIMSVGIQQNVSKKTIIANFLTLCGGPVTLYFSYIHCGNILKNSFHYTAAQVIHQNFIVSIIGLAVYCILVYLSYKIYPLIILKIKLLIFSCIMIPCPYLLDNITSPLHLLLIQIVPIICGPAQTPAMPIFLKHFPIFKRFTYANVTYAIAHALMYIITSFGITYFVHIFGQYGLLIIIIPLIAGYTFGLYHFEKLEKEVGNYPKKISDNDLKNNSVL